MGAKSSPREGGSVAGGAFELQGSPSRFTAATEDDLKEDDPLFLSDEFRMHCYKVLPCAKRFCHDWSTCPFAHFSERAKRRDPRIVKYTAIACPEMKKGEECPRGGKCPYAHNVFEYWLHPTRYRTRLCRDGTSCVRKVCFFAHKPEELRVPPYRPSLPVADDGWAFGVEAPEELEGAVRKLMESETSPLHQRTLSVPPEFFVKEHFQVETPPHRAHSISENNMAACHNPGGVGSIGSAALVETLLNTVNQQVPVTNAEGTASTAESVARALLEKLSLSATDDAQNCGQPLMMQYQSQPLAAHVAGASAGALPVQPLISSPLYAGGGSPVTLGFPCFSNDQLVNFAQGISMTRQNPTLVQEIPANGQPMIQGAKLDERGEAFGIGGIDMVDDLVRELMLQQQQQHDANFAASLSASHIASQDAAALIQNVLSCGQPGLIECSEGGHASVGPAPLRGISGTI